MTTFHSFFFFFSDGDLYSATVADFSATDSLIIKDNLRTEQYDFKQLNCEFFIYCTSRFISFDVSILFSCLAPDFVNALEDENHVYFFFREAAVEHINCGKVSTYLSSAYVSSNWSNLITPYRPFFHELHGFANPIREVRTNFAPNGPPIWSPVSTVRYQAKPLFTLTTSKPPPTSSKTAPSKWSTGSSPPRTTPSQEVPFVLSNCPTFPPRLRKAHLRISKQ